MGVGVVGAAMVVVLAGKTVLGADSKPAAVVVGRSCCDAGVGERYTWMPVVAQSMHSNLQTACYNLVAAPRLEEWAHMAVGCRIRD